MANPPGLAVGYTWSGYTNHWARITAEPTGPDKQYRPLCERSGVFLYVPGHSVMPHHLSPQGPVGFRRHPVGRAKPAIHHDL